VFVGEHCIKPECCVTGDVTTGSSQSDEMELSLVPQLRKSSASPVYLPDDVTARLARLSASRDLDGLRT